jgi:hypothetical protein
MRTRYAGAAPHRTRYRFSWEQAVAALERAEQEDISWGGIYDMPCEAVIRIWSSSAATAQARDDFALVGTIYWDWGQPSTRYIEVFALQVGPAGTLGAVKQHLQKLFGTPLRHLAAGGARRFAAPQSAVRQLA